LSKQLAHDERAARTLVQFDSSIERGKGKP
jgi:hypothetical protein